MDLDLEGGDVDDLEIEGIIGFDGSTIRGFVAHPNGQHVIYPMGNKVIIQDWHTKQQDFLSGHTNIISAINVSKSGKYIASGQINHIGFKAKVIIWDFETHSVRSEHEMHKVRVEAVAFSRDDMYCLSLGGRDCGSLVVWDIALSQVICGSAASRGIQGEATGILTMNRRGACFMTSGDNHLSMWRIDRDARYVHCVDVNTAKLKRNILCLEVDERDEMCYCGTATGDMLKIRLNYHHDPDIVVSEKLPSVIGCFAKVSRKKLPKGQVDLYSQGIRSMRRLPNGLLVIGAGDGTVDLVEETKPIVPKETSIAVKLPSMPALKVLHSTTVHASVTSLRFMNEYTIILAGTVNSEIFCINLKTFSTELLITCHTSTIYDLAFPYNFSEVFATSSKHDVRIWSMKTLQELLRIRVQNFSCSNVVFSYDGKSVLTAWNDGIIRSFTPLTGRLIYAILNAHNKGVSALCTTHKGDLLVSGGCEGQVRLWEVNPLRQQLICTLKEHKGPVSSIHVNSTDNEAVSSSTDGTCIIWDLIRQCRRQILFGNTLFMCARYYPTDVQILTGGSDRKLAYWEVLDGGLVREIEGSKSGAINSLDISADGKIFVTGGNDQIVKLWKYQEGITTHVGFGHSSVVTSARFSPDGKHIVTASASGSIFIWKNPVEVSSAVEISPEKAESKTETKPKEEVEKIQDLPTSRSSVDGAVSVHSGGGDKAQSPVCVCPCTQKQTKKDKSVVNSASSKTSKSSSSKCKK